MPALQKAIAQLMEGRQERPPPGNDPPALAALLAALSERIAPDERALAEAFARELFGKARAVLIESAEPAPLAAMTAGAFAFWRARGTRPVAVRVFSPQTKRDGWQTPLTVIETVLDDRPFIVDTLSAAIEAEGGEIRRLLHPVLGVERQADGTPTFVGPPDAAAGESFFHAEVANLPATPALLQRFTERLEEVIHATDDYAEMRGRITAIAGELRQHRLAPPWDGDRTEAAAFLDWLANKSFVFLGYREYELPDGADGREGVLRPGRGLGILRDDARSSYRTPRALPMSLHKRLDDATLVLVSKTNAVSPIHRAVPMDDIAVKTVAESGRVVGVRRLLGLFTSKAYADAASEVPLLRRTLAAVLAREGLADGSHDYRDYIDLFDTFPREELFASCVADVHTSLRAIATADPAAGIQVLCRPDALQRGLFVTVTLPRARFSTELHGRVSAALGRHLHATILHQHLALDERPVARLHYYCAVPAEILAQPPLDDVRADLDALVRTWEDELRLALGRLHGPSETERLVGRYSRTLPAAYKAGTPVAGAVRDIHSVESLLSSGAAQIELARAQPDGVGLVLKLYLADETLALSEFVPVLENLGFRVLGEDVIELRLPDAKRVGIHAFGVEPIGATPLDVERVGPLVVAALHAVRGGSVDNDRLNTLVSAAGLEWRAVDVIRAYVEHACQIGLATRPTLNDALITNLDCARRLFEIFATAFDPAASVLNATERAAGPVAAAQANFLAGLDAVQSLGHDRILRALGAAVGATVRTNFYTAPPGVPLALKLDGTLLPHLPAPRPALETWVHAVDLHGVHLRAGRVARGGIRASDRPDDFRAEILSLMRTQVVKNAIIVPVGAKGGFIVRGQTRNVAAADQVEAAYRAFIAALLSITDNLVDGQPVPPAGQLIYDEADPYLVVAADKGTATFSDVANEIAAQHGFWLGDAFASGGSRGYDHKRLAITARGAWECARQHFHELGRDLDREAITVIGIGDMSGDVFGNGLLRSRHLRLLAAFDHRDVFLDPDPDPKQSYDERARLYALPSSRWSDYQPAVLSRGGGVYPRTAKSIPLSGEARAMLDIDAAAPSGEDVVRAILRMRADLLWSGGIGTYVKASDEAPLQVADPTNDAVRINAGELRVAVVAEGGNLGLTQRARIEYALAGGHINTDAIDNSAGVDLSDHEVNLKIALQPTVAAGTLNDAARDAVLADLAQACCESVLAHNRSQAMALGLDQWRSRTHLAGFRDLTSILEAEAGLDRQLAQLPTREMLRARRAIHLGLTRPELAVLLANTKLDLQHRLLQSPLCDDPVFEGDLRSYFPADFAERFGDAVLRHPLRREIIAVQLANRLVDRMGMTFLVHAVRDTGHDVVEIVRAWAAARTIADADALAAALEVDQQRLGSEAQRRCALLLADALAAATVWLVEMQPRGRALGDTIERFRDPVTHLLAEWPTPLSEERRGAHQRRATELGNAGLAAEVADRLARVVAIGDALEISHIAAETNAPLTVASEVYFAVEQMVDLDWLRNRLPSVLAGEDRWEARAAAGLLEGLCYARRQLTVNVLAHRRSGTSTAEAMHAYGADCRDQLDVVTGLLADLKAASPLTLPAVLVLMRELGRLAQPNGNRA